MSHNGKPPRKTPRTASHAPTDKAAGPPSPPPPAAGAGIPSPGAEDRPDGRTDALAAPPSSTVSNGRDNRGRFGPSNAFGRGHAGHKRMAELRGAVLEAATPEILSAITKKLAMLALQEGDVAAARLLLEYSCGKPVQGVEISGPDGEPLERSAELSVALGAALAPFSDEIKFAVLGTLKRTINAGRDAE